MILTAAFFGPPGRNSYSWRQEAGSPVVMMQPCLHMNANDPPLNQRGLSLCCRRLGRRFSRLALLQSHARDHGHTHSWHAHPELIPAFLVWIVAWCESCGDDQ